MSFYITNELPPKKKISSVQSNPMKHCTEYSQSSVIECSHHFVYLSATRGFFSLFVGKYVLVFRLKA